MKFFHAQKVQPTTNRSRLMKAADICDRQMIENQRNDPSTITMFMFTAKQLFLFYSTV